MDIQQFCGANEAMRIQDQTRALEEKMASLFSVQKPFSEHLLKWEDTALRDKYDHNCFEYSAQPTRAEFEKALAYQKRIGASFLKLEGNEPLDDAFGLEPCVTLTMALRPKETRWRTMDGLAFRTPALPELEEIEVKHFGPLYGEDFSRRNVRRLYEKLDYHGAYLGEMLIAACYSFSADGLTCIDGLIVDRAFRRQYAATSLIGHVKSVHPEDILVLHADSEDTPEEMYRKMGFETVDRLYEYSRTDL